MSEGASGSVQHGSLKELARSMRMSQWAKNTLVFVPLLAAHEWGDSERAVAAAVAFGTLCMIASGTYLINDLLDIEADRGHPTKRFRPLAAGTISPFLAVSFAAVLIFTGLGFAAWYVGRSPALMLLAYLCVSLTYSVFLKRRMILDVIALAGLFCHRILIGGVATQIEISPWLLAFSLFLFMSLALVKRFIELDMVRKTEQAEIARRAYTAEDAEPIFTMGLVSGYLSILVLCLFVSSDAVSELYENPTALWAIPPIMLYWISRVWLLARRGEIGDDPTAFALRDEVSYVCALAIGLVAIVSL